MEVEPFSRLQIEKILLWQAETSREGSHLRWLPERNTVRKVCHLERSEGSSSTLPASNIQMDPSLRSG